MNGIKMGVTSQILDQNLARDILTRDILARTFHHEYFSARVLFGSADVPPNGHFISMDILAQGIFGTGTCAEMSILLCMVLKHPSDIPAP